MAAVYCDTSFLFSLYGEDDHTPRAEAALRSGKRPVALSVLNEFELENAIRHALWRQAITPGIAASMVDDLEEDIALGIVRRTPADLGRIVADARRLSGEHTAKHGFRAFDILHVAAALQVKAASFLSFDAAQRTLAQKAGLKVGPVSL